MLRDILSVQKAIAIQSRQQMLKHQGGESAYPLSRHHANLLNSAPSLLAIDRKAYVAFAKELYVVEKFL